MSTQKEIAILAGGCFWGVEELMRALPGVTDTEVGYTGGVTKNPVYETVKVGNTGHAESIRVEFDPSVLSFKDLLHWFFKMHDPTTVDRQGNDRGSQYRSAIFFTSDEQKTSAEEIKREAEAKWQKPVVTQVIAAKEFYSAEKYHQDYLQKNPGGYTCHWIRDI
jgi:methionine-S-sulfoxide reductase